jgi:hypothetical protein
MSKKYLIVYEKNPKINQSGLVKYLESENAIDDWEYCLPNSIIIKSSKTSIELSGLIDKKYGKSLTHLITKISDYYGRLPTGYWDLIEKP